MLNNILNGFANLAQPTNLLIFLAASLVGFLGGALPGISGTMMIILFLPLSYALDPIPAFIILTTVYSASVFSGLICAILFRTPGTPEAVATVFDGYPMSQKGRTGEALSIGITSSVVGGLIGSFFLLTLTPLLSKFALSFSSPEYFSLAVMGLTVVVSLGSKDLLKGFLGVLFGLFLGTVGMDGLTGTDRFTFGNPNLLGGIGLIPVIIGLFAVSEVLRKSQQKEKTEILTKKVETKISIKLLSHHWMVVAKSALIGTVIGILPGIGATTAAMVSYSEAVRSSKHPELFGTGIPEGIIAPETANNAAALGTMIPLISLGIPGGASTAVLIGAFVMHGLQPGPMLIKENPSLVYTIFVTMLMLNFVILLLSKPFIKLFTKIMTVPYHILAGFIIVFSIIGTYAVNNSIMDIWLMLLFGLLGFYFDKIHIPLATVILGLVLGPLTEKEFRRSLEMSGGSLSIFFEHPICVVLLLIALLSLALSIYSTLKKKANSKTDR